MLNKHLQKIALFMIIVLCLTGITIAQSETPLSKQYDNVILEANITTGEFRWEHSKIFSSPMEERVWEAIDEGIELLENDERGATLVDYIAMFGILAYELKAVQDIMTEDGDNVWLYYFSRPIEPLGD